MIDGAVTEPEAQAAGRWRVRILLARSGWILASGPAVFLVFVLLHALHVRLYLGRWPVVYQDTPATPLLSIHEYGLLMPAFYFSLFGVPLWLVVGATLVAVGMIRARVFANQLGLMLAGIGGVALLVTLDPTGYIEWFLD